MNNTQYKSEKVNNLKYSKNKTTLVQLPFTTLGQETRWAYSTPPPSPHGATAANPLQLQVFTAENLQLQRVCCCGPVLGQTPYR